MPPADFDADYNLGSPEADLNFDGFVDGIDSDLYYNTYAASPGAAGKGVLSRASVGSRLGSGAEYAVELAGAKYHQRNRMRDSETGIWTRRDPIENPRPFNLYGYADQDPILVRDPSGLINEVRTTAFEHRCTIRSNKHDSFASFDASAQFHFQFPDRLQCNGLGGWLVQEVSYQYSWTRPPFGGGRWPLQRKTYYEAFKVTEGAKTIDEWQNPDGTIQMFDYSQLEVTDSIVTDGMTGTFGSANKISIIKIFCNTGNSRGNASDPSNWGTDDVWEAHGLRSTYGKPKWWDATPSASTMSSHAISWYKNTWDGPGTELHAKSHVMAGAAKTPRSLKALGAIGDPHECFPEGDSHEKARPKP